MGVAVGLPGERISVVSAYDRLRWWLICLGLWAVLELLAALVVAGDDRTLVLL